MLNRSRDSAPCLIIGIVCIGLIYWRGDCRPAKADESTETGERVKATSVLEQQALIPELTWSELDSENKWKILSMLADHMQANFDRIRTWEGTYHVRSIEPQRESFLRSAFAGRVDGRDLSDVTLEREFRIEFAINAQSHKIFRAKTSDLMYWRNRKTDECFNISNTAPADERSYVVGEEYVHFDPLITWPEFNHLLDHPDALHKRAAFRTSSESAKRKHYADMLDPIVFFGHDQDSRLWETMSVCLDAHNGKAGGVQQKKANDAVKCFQADGPQGKFYRFNFDIQPTGPKPDEPILHSSWIFDSEQGFNPISFFMRRDGEVKDIRQMKWRWKRINDIYVPDVILDVFSETVPHGMNLWRECELEHSRVNEPLDPDRFTLQGLGLKEGELIIDEIHRSVDKLHNGKVISIAKFGTQYVAPPKPNNQFAARYLIVVINILAFAVLLVILAIRRKRSNSATQ